MNRTELIYSLTQDEADFIRDAINTVFETKMVFDEIYLKSLKKDFIHGVLKEIKPKVKEEHKDIYAGVCSKFDFKND